MMTFEMAKAKMEGYLHRWGIKNRYAFTALLIGGIMAIMIGAVLLVVSYVVINAVVYSVTSTAQTGALGPVYVNGSCAGAMANGTAQGCLNVSFNASIGAIVQALGIIGIALVVTGIAVIVYILIGLGGVGGGSTRQR
jgi:hypothetical protein